jgi:hypothetical protein
MYLLCVDLRKKTATFALHSIKRMVFKTDVERSLQRGTQ